MREGGSRLENWHGGDAVCFEQEVKTARSPERRRYGREQRASPASTSKLVHEIMLGLNSRTPELWGLLNPVDEVWNLFDGPCGPHKDYLLALMTAQSFKYEKERDDSRMLSMISSMTSAALILSSAGACGMSPRSTQCSSCHTAAWRMK
jgi:hypothetical protein